jgi:hypothetical protein
VRLGAITLERVLCGADMADIPASPLQIAIARAADGRPLDGVLTSEECQAHFGCAPEQLGQERPALVEIIAGVRGGKSCLASCAGIEGSCVADLSALKRHEIARFAIVAAGVDNAEATFRILLGIVGGSRLLSRMCPDDPTADTLVLRRPDGRVVEIVVVAATRGAVTLRSRWLTGFVIDEACLIGAEATGAAVTVEELVRVGETRLVPGGQGWIISSPFGPQGMPYDLWKTHFGKPGRVLVAHAPTRALNPSYPQEQIDAIRERDPDTAAREFDAEWIDADTAFLDGTLIEKAARKEPLELPPPSREAA